MKSSLIRVLIAMLVVGALAAAGYFTFRAWFSPKETKPVAVDPGTANVRPSVPVPQVHFTDVTSAAGIRFKHFNSAAGRKLLPETMAPGVAVLDYDRDGWSDLLFVNSCPWPGHPTPAGGPPTLCLYRNKGDGTFEDVTEKTGLAVTMYGMGVAVGDYDNDGWPDLYITGVGGHRLFHNESAGSSRQFVDVTEKAGVGGPRVWPAVRAEEWYKWEPPIPFGSSATFLDYDGDGKLDLFICHYITWSPARDMRLGATLTGQERAYAPPTNFEGAQCALYRNKGDGTFEDVSAQAGVQVFRPEGTDAGARQRPVGKSLGVIVCDPDGDGWPDLIVANDTTQNFFFHNRPGPNGTRVFVEEGLVANVAYAEGVPRGAMGIDWGEYRPGRNAVLIANFANEPCTFLCLERADPDNVQFSDHALAVGLAGPSRRPLKFGTFFFDYDLDGRQDLLTCNGHLEPEISKVQKGQEYVQPVQLFWNTGRSSGVFEPVTAERAGSDLFKPLVGRGAAYLDYDGDGDLDVVLMENNGPARLLRNDNQLGNRWVRLELVGDGKRSNRDAIGAAVTLEAGGVVQHRYLSGSKGYLSQSEHALTFGLGKAEKIDKVTIRWPGKDGGPMQEWADLKPGATYELRQGEREAKAIKPHGRE
jgi:hypothetical protein